MSYDFTRLGSYVRFYLTVVNQLGAAWDNLGRIHDVSREALSPFSDPLTRVQSPALTSAMDVRPSARPMLEALLQPDDAEGLTGINDVYEVVGRFTFQGEDNKNLARVQQLVSGARNEIVAQRGRLTDLLKLPDQARAVAQRLAAEELARAAADRADKLRAFEPLAEQVIVRAKQTFDAVKAVPMPDLSEADTAADEYHRYAAKLDQVYQTCLPFLKKAVSSLYAFVSCEPGASWPDVLPVIRELPAELVAVPHADSPELSQARASLSALGEEEIVLGRLRDDAVATINRLEGEIQALDNKDKALEQDFTTASAILTYVSTEELAQAARAELAAAEQQKAARVEIASRVWQRQKQIEAAIAVLDEELKTRQGQIAELREQLNKERSEEPVLFGKDDWRMRVAAIEASIETQQGIFQARQSTLNQFRIDLSSVNVEVQTEQAQSGLIDRQIAEVRARLDAMTKAVREMGERLGPSRPARAVASSDAREALGALQDARAEIGAKIERLKNEVRRQKEETLRVVARMKQVITERQQFGAMLESAQLAVTQGREAAAKKLAADRRSAVERHVTEVLHTLEKSASMAGQVFIDPARVELIKSTEPRADASQALLDAAEKVAPVVERLARELDPDLLSQDASLGQIQREFCDVAVSACRAAWG